MVRAPGLLQPVLLPSLLSCLGPQERWAGQADIRSGSICRKQVRKLTLNKAVLHSAVLNMSAILENSAVATGLGKVFSFQSQRKAVPRMFKLLHSSTPPTHQKCNAQDPSTEASTVRELRTFRCTSWI